MKFLETERVELKKSLNDTLVLNSTNIYENDTQSDTQNDTQRLVSDDTQKSDDTQSDTQTWVSDDTQKSDDTQNETQTWVSDDTQKLDDTQNDTQRWVSDDTQKSDDTQNDTQRWVSDDTQKSDDTPIDDFNNIENKIISLIKNDNKITKKQLAETLGVSKSTITRYLKQIKYITHIGSSRTGSWKIMD